LKWYWPKKQNPSGYHASGISNFLIYNQECTWKNGASQLAVCVPADQ